MKIRIIKLIENLFIGFLKAILVIMAIEFIVIKYPDSYLIQLSIAIGGLLFIAVPIADNIINKK